MKARLTTLEPAERDRYRTSIAALEATARYPLGTDRFRIDHGEDYFAFFDRLGALRYEMATVGDEVVAVGAGILREVPIGGSMRDAWYLCDLKVHPLHRGRRIPFALAQRAIPRGYLRCPRGYAVSMDPAGRGRNPVVELLSRWRIVPLSLACTLHVFSLDAESMRRAAATLARHDGRPPRYLSLSGIKDIVLESTGAPMPLWHVQRGPCASPGGRDAPLEGAVHMLCAPREDALCRELEASGVAPSASASVVHHGMGGCDFRFILTSDI